MRPSLSEGFVAALRDRTHRDAHNLYVAEGTRFLISASNANADIVGLVVNRRAYNDPLKSGILAKCQAKGVPILHLEKTALARLAATIREVESERESQGVLTILRQPWEPPPAIISKKDLWIAVETVQSSGNLGTILRTGDAVGATGLIVFDRSPEGSPSGVDPFDPAAVRATMGSIFRHRFIRTTHHAFRRWARRWELTVVGATPHAATDYRCVTYRRPTILMLGDERKGLSEGQLATCDALVRIPMVGSPDSLNIAMAGAVLLYEVHNQRHPVKRRA